MSKEGRNDPGDLKSRVIDKNVKGMGVSPKQGGESRTCGGMRVV